VEVTEDIIEGTNATPRWRRGCEAGEGRGGRPDAIHSRRARGE